MTSSGIAYSVHCSLDDGRKSVIKPVSRLAVLKIHVGILGRAAQVGMLRVHAPAAETLDFIPVDQRAHGVIVNHQDSIHLGRCAPSVKKVQHRERTVDGGEVSHEREVHGLLHRG